MALAAFPACKNEPKTAEAEKPAAPEKIQMTPTPSPEGAAVYNITEGTVYWTGRKSVKGQHNGKMNVKAGSVIVKEGRILGGKIQVDMTSLEIMDELDDTQKGQLLGHLKSDDFFGANRYPTAEFTIQEQLPSNTPDFNNVIAGTLTMKDKTNPVNIPVKLKLDENELSAESATFIINRTKWGINFGSGIIGTVKDKMIDDNVSVAITIKAKKG